MSGVTPPWARIAWMASAASLLVAGLLLFVLGITPWLAPFAVLFCLFLAIGQRTSWPFAIAASVIVEIALIALMVRFAPSLGLGLVPGAAIILGLLGVAGLVAFAVVRSPRVIGGRALRVGVPIIVVPVALMVVVAVRSVNSGDLEWAMHNDAVWNLISTRLIVADGGLDAIAHPNPSPLTPGLLAVAIAVGRDAVAPADLLRHDVSGVAVFWLLASLGAALLAALIGARSVHGGTRTARIAGAVIAALMPLTWFTFGFASQFGFYNATFTLLLLLASWLAWLEARVAPIAAAATLSLATVALLSTWAPLAIIPFALAAVAIVSRTASLHRSRTGDRRWFALVLAVLPVPLYVAFVTLPDLRRDGAALAVDGGIMQLRPAVVLAIMSVTVAVAILNAVQRGQRHNLVGVLAVCAGAVVAGAYLIGQRAGAGASLWGYYPVKFAWLFVSLLIVVLAASLAGEMAGLRGRPIAASGVAVAALAVPTSLMLLVPPPTQLFHSLLTPVAIATASGTAGGSPAARTLFDLAEPGHPTIAVDHLGPSGDRFLNSWLLQLESTSASEPIRLYSYILDPENPAQACEAAASWGRQVRIVTSAESTADELSELCTDADVVIEVRP
ncbi:hypothetical protein [Microbacterium sp. ProA8]|uniref:hypothetical protein n=1 Tax=Microbacterium chionoecetis TaxID=3153754 RepID=UPI003266DE06